MSNESIRHYQDAVADVMARVPYCWLVTQSQQGVCTARPMGRILPGRAGPAWTLTFVTDGRSQKAAEVELTPDVQLIFQDTAAEAFVTLGGEARLLKDSVQVSERWKSRYDVYFPTEGARAHAAFVEIEVGVIRMWIRGITPEPFGMQPTVLERNRSGEWRVSTGRSG